MASRPPARTASIPTPASLGLPTGASTNRITSTRDQVLAYLDDAPVEIAGWARTQSQQLRSPVRPRRRRRPLLILAAVLLLPLLVWGVYKMGEVPATPAGAAALGAPGEAVIQVDQERVAALEARVEADPADTAAMSELGTIYITAGDLERAGHWQQRILADHPDDIDARLALGVVLFNQGDLEAAERQWLRASELDPDKAEPHYNLGFLHLAADEPDMAKVEEHWGRVVELAPDSDMAATIANHLSTLGGPADEGAPDGDAQP